MKQALDALELALNGHGVMLLSDPPQDAWKTRNVESKVWDAITALRAAIEQAEKPVAWMYDFMADNEVIRDWITQSQDDIRRENGFNVRPLYAAPRQWVGLTDEELDAIYAANGGTRTRRQIARAIEAKLKGKNHG